MAIPSDDDNVSILPDDPSVGEVGGADVAAAALRVNAARRVGARWGQIARWVACGILLWGWAMLRAAEGPRTIRVVMDSNYPPYVFHNEQGKLQGILVDQWRAWEKQTGIKAEIHAMDWSEALARMGRGEFDVIDTIFETNERRGFFDFTPAYARIEVPIFFRREISGITDLDSLRGVTVAAKDGDHAADLLKAAGVTSVRLFANYETIVAAARRREVNVFVVDAPPAIYFLNKLGIDGEFRRSPPINRGEFHRAVRKGNAALLRAVEQGFAGIEAEELSRIDEKWMGRELGGGRYLAYVGYAAGVALLLIAVLVVWNRTLRKRVAHRTAALQESEARFRQVVENIQEVFWMSDVEKNRIIYISPGYEAIWGRSCASLYESPQSWLESIFPEDRERVLRAATTKQLTGEYDETYRVVRPDGTVRWVRDRAYPIKTADHKAWRIVGVAEDVTHEREMENRSLRTQRLEAIGTLSSGIAHDLNNILSPMLMVAPMLRDKLPRPEDRELLDIIEQGARRGAHIIRQLLTFSRGIDGERVAVQIRHLVKEMVAIARETFPRNIAIVEHAAQDLALVSADATQLHQVLMNLCLNARDAMPAGGTLTLRVENVRLEEGALPAHLDAKPGSYVLMTVGDTGHGIPAEIIDRVFEPFFTTKGVGKGTGLGLSTVLGIVKSHRGFVTSESVPGKGAKFSVYLPAILGNKEPAAAPEGSSPPDGAGETVLVIDDEAAIRESIVRALEQKNYRVLTAGDGQAGLTVLRQHRAEIRVVVVDLMMPVMGGVATIRALREEDPDIKIVPMSGMVPDEERAELRALGLEEILNKPFAIGDLWRAITRALNGRSWSGG